jgi:hypothetical protein
MKTSSLNKVKGVFILIAVLTPIICSAQSESSFIGRYLTSLPVVSQKMPGNLLKYRMTAVYTNMDIYGNFTSKTKVTGDYTRGLPGDTVAWNNVYISGSLKSEEPFSTGTKQEYMENIKYVSSSKMVEDEDSFKSFPANPENILARNLIWDMMSFELFAWDYYDSLKLNHPYILPDIKGQFNLGGIGNYSHKRISVSWSGTSCINRELCAVIEFNATDNKIEMNLAQIKTRGTEQYWGTILISLETKEVEKAVMYGGTIQEIEVSGLKDKLLVKTIRDLTVEKIQ